MASSGRAEGRTGRAGWLTTVLGILVLVTGGFTLGLVVGVISEEPELVVGHVTGRSTEVDWSAGAPATPTDAFAGDAAPAARDVEADAVAAADVGRPGSGASRPQAPTREVPAASTGRPKAAAPLPPVAARGPAPAPAAAEGGYAIQVGAFASAEAAQGLASRLRTAGYPVHVIAPERDDRWRVRVGPVASRDEADRTASRLKSEQALPTWVLREERS